jgi:alkanesulfonate monooxygenase SsuD/methylene tetrahydromethanopterin reductase-like flavin-dependent oxidoreductase (luciferase family)
VLTYDFRLPPGPRTVEWALLAEELGFRAVWCPEIPAFGHDIWVTLEIEISTKGLPRLFTRFPATALAEGRRVADRPAEPSHYLAVYDLWKRRDSRVSMQ